MSLLPMMLPEMDRNYSILTGILAFIDQSVVQGERNTL
jgi:hypothetical protein